MVMLYIDSYLARIAYNGPRTPTAETLRSLHRAHMLSVPFENLDISRKREIICDEHSILRKVVAQKRGGFCYELNGAFAALLRELGFRVTMLSARVARQDGGFGAEFDHLTLRVDLEEPWLADVGFGDSFQEPLRLKVDLEQPQGCRRFRLIEEGGVQFMEMAEPGADWIRQYAFTLAPHCLQDFSAMCRYHQTSPQSSFTQNKICSRATPDGRVTLADNKLIITKKGERQDSVLSDEDWKSALKKYFDIVL